MIELLVVITIIVVLLALLTPALDKAIYQAELAVCGANLKAIGGGVMVYASENRRLYPYRPSGPAVSFNIVWGTPALDDRPNMRRLLSINKALIDPFCRPVDLEHAVFRQNYVYASYNLWWGWQWVSGAAKGQRMRKVGDRFNQPGDDRFFRFLATDWDRISDTGASQGGHPDRDGIAINLTAQGQSLQDDPTGSISELADGLGNIYTVSQWWAPDASSRGSLDRNFLYDDLSVVRLGDLKNGPNDEPDERLVTVNSRFNMDLKFWEYLPWH